MTGHFLVKQVVMALRREGLADTAAGLAACGDRARTIVPTRGLLLSHGKEDENYREIERIALKHFALRPAQRDLRKALSILKQKLTLLERDAIETASLRVAAAREEAYYYAGLAVGLTAAPMSQSDQKSADSSRKARNRSRRVRRPGRSRQ